MSFSCWSLSLGSCVMSSFTAAGLIAPFGTKQVIESLIKSVMNSRSYLQITQPGRRETFTMGSFKDLERRNAMFGHIQQTKTKKKMIFATFYRLITRLSFIKIYFGGFVELSQTQPTFTLCSRPASGLRQYWFRLSARIKFFFVFIENSYTLKQEFEQL